MAARVDGEVTALRAGMLAARESLARAPGEPIDAAEAGLRASGGAARAVGVLSDTDLLAQAGKTRDVAWRDTIDASEHPGAEPWVGVVDSPTLALNAVVAVSTSQGRRWIVAVGDPARLARIITPTAPEALATRDGRLLAAGGQGGVAEAQSVNQAFALAPDELKFGAFVTGKRPDGMRLDLVARPAAGAPSSRWPAPMRARPR